MPFWFNLEVLVLRAHKFSNSTQKFKCLIRVLIFHESSSFRCRVFQWNSFGNWNQWNSNKFAFTGFDQTLNIIKLIVIRLLVVLQYYHGNNGWSNGENHEIKNWDRAAPFIVNEVWTAFVGSGQSFFWHHFCGSAIFQMSPCVSPIRLAKPFVNPIVAAC